MKSTMEELKVKLKSLETYCNELKQDLKRASNRTKPVNISRDNFSAVPVSVKVLAEGFLQVVSEARLSVKHLCKALIENVQETNDDHLTSKLISLLHPRHKPSLVFFSKRSLYHFESLMNKCLYQDFENRAFKNSGAPKFLDPCQDCRASLSAFIALRDLGWDKVVKKGTKIYSEDFRQFCDRMMTNIGTILDSPSPWPENLLRPFFVAAKCVWLLHLLAFSFNPPLMILRVDENREYDPLYMVDLLHVKEKVSKQVKMMVAPGFYIGDRVLRCKVLCRYDSSP